MPASRRAITSRVTVQNPRPRKYASAAEKQAAFRARFPTLCVRVEPKTADTVQAVADASGRTQQETLLSMLKYAMTNRNWLTLGLTEHKQLPRKENPTMKTEILERAKLPNGTLVRLQKRGKAYDVITNSTGITWRYLEKAVSEERARNAFDLYTMQAKKNPMKTTQVKRKPTPAQIAARERFAEMARSGAFKRSNNPMQKWVVYYTGTRNIAGEVMATSAKAAKEKVAEKVGTVVGYLRATKSNPAKKTVSQKISQLTREGYPQKQAVAIALSEERAGKVKRNPITETLIYGLEPGETRDYMEVLLYDGGLKLTQAQIDQVLKAASAAGFHSFRIAGFDPTVKPDFTKALKTGRRRSNPRASNPINSGIKYACIMPELGGMAYGIDERTPVTIRFSASELKRAYKCYLIPATVRESAGYKRLIAKQKEVYMSLAELKQLFRSFV